MLNTYVCCSWHNILENWNYHLIWYLNRPFKLQLSSIINLRIDKERVVALLLSPIGSLFLWESQWKQIAWLAISPLAYTVLRLPAHSLPCLLPATCWFLAWFNFLPWRWKWYAPQKCQLTFIRLQENRTVQQGLLLVLFTVHHETMLRFKIKQF
jgi:hypothetical protein